MSISGYKTTFWKLISDPKLKEIKIPQIQRDYVQGRDDDKIIFARERLLDEMRYSIMNKKSLDLNFVYGKEDDQVFIPIDGQQRLTTLLILHIYAFGKDNCLEDIKLLKKFVYETRISTKRFFSKLIDNIKEYFVENNEYITISSFIKDSAWYSLAWERDPSIKSALIVLNDIDDRFKDIEGLSLILKGNECSITFMELKIENVGKINDLYIKMNSRGKPLTEFENFKSSLYEHIDKINYSFSKDFKSNMDNRWLSFIWEITANPEKNTDDRFMRLLDVIIINRLMGSYYFDISFSGNDSIFYMKKFYNFSHYKEYINIEMLNDIHKTFDFLLFYSGFNDGEKPDEWLKDILNSHFLPSHKERVRLSSFTKYAISVERENWNIENFNKWYRIINNLIKNTRIEDFYDRRYALYGIYNISASYCINAEKEFAHEIKSISGFNREQLKEEQLKCKLIVGNHLWKDVILNAEANKYFDSEINFAFKLCDINVENADSLSENIKKITEFKQKWEVIELIFNISYTDNVVGANNVFRRALLTFDDFSMENRQVRTFFYEYDSYFNWRRLLREEKTFNIFKLLFDDLLTTSPVNTEDIEKRLLFNIEKYDNIDKSFIYYMVKRPEVWVFMNEKRYRIDNVNNRVILYSGRDLRSKYAEAYTYFTYLEYGSLNAQYKFGTGNLYSDATSAYISEVNNCECYILFDFEENYFFNEDREPYLDFENNPITTVKDMVEYMKRNF